MLPEDRLSNFPLVPPILHCGGGTKARVDDRYAIKVLQKQIYESTAGADASVEALSHEGRSSYIGAKSGK